jgi:hypothetical protein
VRRLISASVAVFGLIFALALALVLAFSTVALGQINGPPSSVTSPGFGGRAINGAAPSVTSVGPHGYAPNVYGPSPSSSSGQAHHHHHTSNNIYAGPWLYAYPVPYAPDYTGPDPNADADDDSNYQGGPTVFDRRGAGAESYVPPVSDVPKPHAASLANDPADDPAPAPTPTLLVFKDGHNLEVANYAIVGVTLFDLTPGHARKVDLADLDLNATRQQNEDRGVVFQLPPAAQAN